jgi:valyl-tRNA synthetase
MLHPFAPFVTEQIYQRLYREQKSIMLEKIVVPKSNKYVMPIETKLLLTIYSVIKD